MGSLQVTSFTIAKALVHMLPVHLVLNNLRIQSYWRN